MLLYVLCFHVYCKAGFELDRDFVIVDGDLFYHAADKRLAIFCLAGLFLDEGDHGLDPVDFVFTECSLRQNVLPPFAEGYYPFSDLLDAGFVLAGIKKFHLTLVDHIVNDLDFLIDIAADN